MTAGSHAIEVRPATARDVPLIEGWLNDPGNPLWQAKDLLQALSAPAYQLIVACDARATGNNKVENAVPVEQANAQTPLGFALLRGVDNEWNLLYLLVAPAARRSGVAEALLQWLQSNIAHEAGSLLLEVRCGNQAATALYKKCGFVEQGVRPRYYEPLQVGGQREDALLLGWNAVKLNKN
ncbi:MAG: GNAT family N-acetyltransferase [Gammaproteobacteria bacterium]|nr:GNAT family N-acetyltransferase [Gammaproteobacteria bacterium]MBT8152024.1 GNAT family N-acetyltransferase [Gammaproteobacteria bacterium]NND39490.1 GNAT family N-acetyltransferase [Pseudomonadales bacterium]NNL10707.1 GNAT family N-acetyltransferase [Pseudomonadales bacterium]NNM10697.1 GNAT family N-acetyltransferase [Pseudomonadales bacterium]